VMLGLSSLVLSTPTYSSVTRSSARIGGSPVTPLTDPRNVPRAVEQVHLTGGSADSVYVTWVSNERGALKPSVVQLREGSGEWRDITGGYGHVYSAFQQPAPWQVPPSQCNNARNYTNPDCFYTSGVLHHVELLDLPPSAYTEYRIKGDSRSFGFTSPPARGERLVRFGVVGDLGQTGNSSATVAGLLAAVQTKQIDSVLLAGDLSYSDGDHQRWDSYARLYEPLWAAVPTAHVGGNHEASNSNENWLGYMQRYPNAHERSGSASFLWYSFESGPAHVVMLCSYAATAPGSSQYEWLQGDLASVNRSATPWIVVVVHTPWYTSNAHHPMSEGAAMRAAMEPLLLAARVDIVLNGHVHAYERTHPVAAGAIDEDKGITHVTIGDGGNREHFALPWLPAQPQWSALREYAYGWGTLELNETHAIWSWLRNDDPWNPPGDRVGDRFVLEARR